MVSSKQWQRCCEKEVKELASLSKKSHKTCSYKSNRGYPIFVQGKYLHRYFGVNSMLQRRKLYRICRNLERCLCSANILKPNNGNRNPPETLCPPSTSPIIPNRLLPDFNALNETRK